MDTLQFQENMYGTGIHYNYFEIVLNTSLFLVVFLIILLTNLMCENYFFGLFSIQL